MNHELIANHQTMTLTQVAALTKKIIIASIILGILGIASLVGLNFYRQYQTLRTPPKVEAPKMAFGALPTPIFPASSVSSANFTYSIDTTTGGLPQTPRLVNVYFIPQTGISLLAPDKAKQLATSFGFTFGPQVLSEGTYQFSDGFGGNLKIDIASGNFHFQKVATISAVPTGIPDQNNLIGLFKKYLAGKNLLPDDLSSGQGNVVSGDITEVSIRPADIDKLPIATPLAGRGLVRAIYANTTNEDKFTKLDYTFWVVDKTTSSTYLLKSPDEAFSDLRSGKGYINIIPDKPTVSISSVSLAYYESEDYSPYLQPVFIFEGPNFMAIVPAVSPPATQN